MAVPTSERSPSPAPGPARWPPAAINLNELEDTYLVAPQRGSADAYERSSSAPRLRRARRRPRTSSSAASEDLIQEGLVGLYKPIRDFRSDRESSFRNFAELCITRQIITAVKTASRNKHAPLNQYVSFAPVLAARVRPRRPWRRYSRAPISEEPAERVIASEELSALVSCLSGVLSGLEPGLVAVSRRLLL